jgi:hypothetical protein
MDYESRQRRLDRAYDVMLTELFVGFVVMLLTWFLWIASAGYIGPMFYERSLFEGVPVAHVLCTLAWIWMLRLSRPQPEAAQLGWRYRQTSRVTIASWG